MQTYGLYKNGKLLGRVKADSKLQAHTYWDKKHPDRMADQVKALAGNTNVEPTRNQFKGKTHPFWG